MKDCIFCKIVSGEVPSIRIYEDAYSVAFLDINPANEGHTLLIPKEHYGSLIETPDELLAPIFKNSKKLMSAVKNATGSDYVILSVIGLDIPHFHIHLVPQFHNDGLKDFGPTKKYESMGKMKEMGEKIKKNLN